MNAVVSAGAKVTVEHDGAVVVRGLTSAEIGELSARNSLTLHELVPLRASLEDAFMALTADAVEYRTNDHGRPPPDTLSPEDTGVYQMERS